MRFFEHGGFDPIAIGIGTRPSEVNGEELRANWNACGNKKKLSFLAARITIPARLLKWYIVTKIYLVTQAGLPDC